MNCPNCNNKVVSKAKFCAGCGYDVSNLNENSGLGKIKNKMPFKMILASIIVVGILFLGINRFNESNELYTFRSNSNEYVGYMNKKGEIVIEPKFNGANPFYKGSALVNNKDNQLCIINKKGEITKTLKGYELTADIIGFSYGDYDYDYEYYDYFDFDTIGRFEDGLHPVKLDGKYGYINKKGELVIKNKFDKVSNFNDGLATVCVNDKYGVINTKGEFVIKPQYDFALEPSEGLIAVAVDGAGGFVNKKGKFVIKPQYEAIFPFSDGLAAVCLDKEWGYIDKKGKFVVEPQYEAIMPFSEELAAVSIDGEWGYIDTNGNMLIEPQHMDVSTFKNGVAHVLTDNGIYRCIDKYGKKIIPVRK